MRWYEGKIKWTLFKDSFTSVQYYSLNDCWRKDCVNRRYNNCRCMRWRYTLFDIGEGSQLGLLRSDHHSIPDGSFLHRPYYYYELIGESSYEFIGECSWSTAVSLAQALYNFPYNCALLSPTPYPGQCPRAVQAPKSDGSRQWAPARNLLLHDYGWIRSQ